MTDAVYIENVQFRWPDSQRTVLDVKSLRIAEREKVFLHGPSGSGKTTLLSLIGGINTPDSGEVNVFGTSMSLLSASARDQFRADRIGFIFQLFNLIPYLTVLQNVLLPCQFSRTRKGRIGENSTAQRQTARHLLEKLGLSDDGLLSSPATDLSVGQQQRVAAARALIGSPDLIIADEPTSSLDADNRTQFIDLLMSECEASDTSLLFVSHDLDLSGNFDRCVKLADINQPSTGTRQ